MRVQLAIRWTILSWKDCYFWTFTFPDAVSWQDIAARWKAIHRRLDQAPMRWPWCGVRVFETHPGGHGVHIHCAVPHRYEVKAILSLLKFHPDPLCGHIGVAHVKAATRQKVADYMATYLAKWRWAAKPPKGARLWATFGLAQHEKTRLCDIETDGPHKRCWDFIDAGARWHLLMTEFDIDPRPRSYHKLLCLKQLFAMPDPCGFLGELMPDAPVDYLRLGGDDIHAGREAFDWQPRPVSKLFPPAPGSLLTPVDCSGVTAS